MGKKIGQCWWLYTFPVYEEKRAILCAKARPVDCGSSCNYCPEYRPTITEQQKVKQEGRY